MTTLLKRKEVKKMPSFPKFTENEGFKNRFFKLAKYLAKIDEVDDYLVNLSYLVEEDLTEYNILDINSVHLDDEIEYLVKTIVSSRAKINDFEDVKVIYSETSNKVYAILPTCTSTTDGNTYILRHPQKFSTCQFFSVGYLLLASLLEKSVLNVRPAEMNSIFTYSSKNWRFHRAIDFYNIALNTLLKLEYNYSLNMKFSAESGKTISTFRTDKKYQDEILNKNTLFNKMGFRKVEVDTETYEGQPFDYKEFAQVERDFASIVDKLPHADAKPELRFRKLGKHKAWGLYSPFLNIIAVDIRHTESMIHEYGHYLDFKHSSKVYSETPAFSPIIDGYREKLIELSKLEVHANILSKLDYYITPTEVFARAFELWVHGTIVSHSTVLHSSETYNNCAEYLAFQNMKEMIFSYFESIFPNDERKSFQFAADFKNESSRTFSIEPIVDIPTVGEQLSLF